MHRSGFYVPPYRDVKEARMDPDETMLVSLVDYEGSHALLVWDYRIDRPFERRFELCNVAGIGVWICYEIQ
eukprot:jgi/Hompol1/6063/HPOL_004825-RA